MFALPNAASVALGVEEDVFSAVTDCTIAADPLVPPVSIPENSITLHEQFSVVDAKVIVIAPLEGDALNALHKVTLPYCPDSAMDATFVNVNPAPDTPVGSTFPPADMDEFVMAMSTSLLAVGDTDAVENDVLSTASVPLVRLVAATAIYAIVAARDAT